MKDGVSFRELCIQEEIADALLSLGDSLFDQRVNSRETLNRLAVKYSLHAGVIAAQEGDRLIGLCAWYDNDEVQKKAFISILVIDQSRQGRGVGTGLLREVLKRCQRNHMNTLSAEVSAKNARAAAFYIKNGFRLQKTENETRIYTLDIQRESDREEQAAFSDPLGKTGEE